MNLPNIDIASLPGLDAAMGVFGSAASQTVSYGDTIVAIMVYVYDVTTTQSLI